MPKAQLVELFADGFGVISEARLILGPGFNVVTGETGAGKTLLVDALTLCLGAETVGVRHALTSTTRVAALFERDGVELLVSREAGPGGRLRSLVDGAPSSAGALRALAGELLVVHGQHESISLGQRSEILRRLDHFGAIDTRELAAARRQLEALHELRDDLGGDRDARERERSFLQFQLDELEAAAIVSDAELEELLDRLTRLSALRDDQSALRDVLELFDGDSEDAVLLRFAQVLTRLPDDVTYDAIRHDLNSALVQARDALGSLGVLADPEAVDDATIEQLEDRAAVLQQIARKYGSIPAARALGVTARERLAALEGESARLTGLDQEIDECAQRGAHLAAATRRAREQVAAALTRAVASQLARVALVQASVRFEVDGDDGADARLLFAASPGQAEGPLGALASGGELSRVLLAIALVTADEDVVAVYDEIDAGLGGQVAQQIGECLREVGQRQQVLAITHLASVAARADRHFVIEKSFAGGVTTTSVHPVEGEARVREIARMLAGDDLTSQSLALARQLLENSGEVVDEVTNVR